MIIKVGNGQIAISFSADDLVVKHQLLGSETPLALLCILGDCGKIGQLCCALNPSISAYALRTLLIWMRLRQYAEMARGAGNKRF